MQKKLKQRIIAGAIMIPAVVLALLYLSAQWFALALGMIACIAAWEWANLVAYRGLRKIMYVGICLALFILGWFYLQQQHIRLLMLGASAYWVLVLMLLSFYQPNWVGNYLLKSFLTYSGYFIIFVGWLSMVTLHEQDPALLLFMLSLIHI